VNKLALLPAAAPACRHAQHHVQREPGARWPRIPART